MARVAPQRREAAAMWAAEAEKTRGGGEREGRRRRRACPGGSHKSRGRPADLEWVSSSMSKSERTSRKVGKGGHV